MAAKGGKRTLVRHRSADISNRAPSGMWLQTVSDVSRRRISYSFAAAAKICRNHIGYRHFRTDRIKTLEATAERYPRRRASPLKAWRALHGVPEI
jgi:hypothetical protein